ncbi:MAG: ABC transporter ATP-binding protein [Bacilli bacterium]|nr:ABC transporter ATP-binding protein [Bacilli bacterium]MDD4407135.1 ABC transporter ATP-binding protein [Bacilli bacterium]
MKSKQNLNQDDTITLSQATKIYNTKTEKIIALNNLNLSFKKGKFYAIMGHSGSGKSTLISVLGLITTLSEGNYNLFGREISNLTENQLSEIRSQHLGFVFQSYYLYPTLKAFENVMIPMLLNKNIKEKNREKIALELLQSVGLKDRANHFPRELSGGEQQRVAIARALANDPNIILADEPTGNLDEQNEIMIFEKLKQLSKEGKCIIVVSHSQEVKKYADIILELNKGNMKKVSDENDE